MNVHVALCCNDAYAPMAATVVVSAARHAANPSDLCFHVFHHSLSSESQQALERMALSVGVGLQVHSLASLSFDGLPLTRHTFATYLRLHVASALPEVSRLIYLDCDTVVVRDLAELLEEDRRLAADAPFAACIAPTQVFYPSFRQHMVAIGMSGTSDYFNAGVMVIRPREWVQADITNRTIASLKRLGECARYADQDGLNTVAEGLWERLHPRWNLQVNMFYEMQYRRCSGADAWREAISHPGVIHFATTKKPWFYPWATPLSSRFLERFRETRAFFPRSTMPRPRRRRDALLAARRRLDQVAWGLGIRR